MLDQNTLNSVLTTGTAGRTETRSKEDAGDGSAFSAAFSDATASPKSKASKAEKEEAKAESKDSKDKKRDAKEHEDAKLAEKPQDRMSAIHMKKLMSKNVDTLSLAEKQALRLAEFADQSLQNVKTQPQLVQQPVVQAPQASKAGKTAKSPSEMGLGNKDLAANQRGEERADAKTLEAVEQLQKKDHAKSSSANNLDQLLVKESSFADELHKTSSADKARERQGVIDQILSQIEVRNFANRTELHLKLNPEYLGELKVKLVHTDDGIRADFETSNKATRELLREGEEDLKAQAKSKGVRFKSMRFTLVEKGDSTPAKG